MAGPLIRRRDFRTVPVLARKLPGTRLGGRRNPEANPVKPRVPGTRDNVDLPFTIRRRLLDELEKNGQEIGKLLDEDDPLKRGRIDRLLDRSNKIIERLEDRDLGAKRT